MTTGASDVTRPPLVADAKPASRLPIKLDLDRRVVRETFTLRLLAYVIAALGGLWLAAVAQQIALRVTGVLACAFALMWLARGLRERSAALQVTHHVLLDHEGLAQCHADKITTRSWRDVGAVTVDEDRLVVVIDSPTHARLVLEPIYGGLGVYALRDVIAETWRAATTSAADASPNERS